MTKGMEMIDYEYSTVTVKTPNDRVSLAIKRKDEKLHLKYRDPWTNNVIISLECYIEDWRDLFPRIVEERIHLNRRGGARPGETIALKDLKITGQLNPLINMIVFAFCSPQAAKLALKLIDCEPNDLENFLDKNRGLQSKSAVKYAKIIDEFMDKAFLRMKYLVDDQGPRLSEILKTARNAIAQYEEQSLEFQNFINQTKNKIAYARGRFLVVEILDPETFENIYEPEQYAVVDLELPYGYNTPKPLAVALGRKRANDYHFTLTYSHTEWDFICDTLSEVPASAFSAIESYSDMTA